MAVMLHPHTVRRAFVLGETLVLDADSQSCIRRAMDLSKRVPEARVELRENLTVQRPCPFTLFEGQHVQHRTFAPDCGDDSSTFYRFPRVVTNEEAAEWFEANDIQYTPVHCFHEYDCCGHWYTSGSYTHRDRKQTLVQISWYRNV